jgi:hypothetical protein
MKRLNVYAQIHSRPTIQAGILQMNPEQWRIFALFPRSGKTGGRRGRLPSPWADPTVVERLIRPFSVIFERTPPVGCS